MPNETFGYSQQPVELFGLAPPGKHFKDLFPLDEEHGDYLTLAAIDVYSDRGYEIYWGENGKVRRRGDDATLTAISQSPGRALVMPFREKLLFAVLGDASGFLGSAACWSITALPASKAVVSGDKGCGTTGRSAG